MQSLTTLGKQANPKEVRLWNKHGSVATVEAKDESKALAKVHSTVFGDCHCFLIPNSSLYQMEQLLKTRLFMKNQLQKGNDQKIKINQ